MFAITRVGQILGAAGSIVLHALAYAFLLDPIAPPSPPRSTAQPWASPP